MWCDTLSVDAEDVTAIVRLHKCHCEVSLTVVGDVGGGEDFGLALRDPVAALSPDGKPVEGVRSLGLEQDASGAYVFSVLRHGGFPLWLDVTGSGGVVRSFGLGGFISGSGYDWDAEDLPDISLRMECALTGVRTDEDRWTVHFSKSVTI